MAPGLPASQYLLPLGRTNFIHCLTVPANKCLEKIGQKENCNAVILKCFFTNNNKSAKK